MLKSWRLGSLLGFPIEVNVSFLMLLAVVFLAFGGLAGVVIVSLAFASVLLHELGHALVARKLHVGVSGIELGFLGGAAKMTDLPRTANHEIAIAVAGPIVSLVLAGLGLGLGSVLHVPLIAMIGWINLVLAGFNLIPALPMDGGRILRAALAKRMTFVKATDASVQVARVVAIGFVVWGLVAGSVQLLILAPFLWVMGTRERVMARMIEMHQGHGGYPGGHPRAGDGVEVLGRGAWEQRQRSPFGGQSPRRYTISQVGGRFVIQPLD
ncbi:MAG: site-2 protease family protein [Myxococcales bacterium]|nr:site-2 protease family protein [Myxococcales bacterium]